MKFNAKIHLCILFLLLALISVNVLITSRKSEKGKAKRLLKYGTEARLDFFTQNRNLFQGRYVYDFGQNGRYDAINKGNPKPITDREEHRELGRGGFGRVAIARKEGSNEEFIIKIMDVNQEDNMNGGGDRTVAKSSILIKEQNENGRTDYIMKYYGAKTFKCLGGRANCAALLLEKINGEELWSFLEKKQQVVANASPQQVANLLYTLMMAGLDFYNRYGRYHYDIKPQNFMITKIETQCWTAKMIDIDGSVNDQEIARGEAGGYTPPYAHPQFLQNLRSKRPFLTQDKYCIGATMFDVYKMALRLPQGQPGCPNGDGLFGCVALKMIPGLKQQPRFPKGVNKQQNDALLDAMSAMLQGGDYMQAGSLIEKAFPQIKQCNNPAPKASNRPQNSPQQPGGQPQFNPQQPGGQPQFNPQRPGGQPKFNPQQPGGQPQFNPQQPGGQGGQGGRWQFNPQLQGDQPQFNPQQPRGQPQFNPQQPRGQPQFFPQQQGGQPQFNPQRPVSPGGQPQFNPQQPRGQPQFNPQRPGGQGGQWLFNPQLQGGQPQFNQGGGQRQFPPRYNKYKKKPDGKKAESKEEKNSNKPNKAKKTNKQDKPNKPKPQKKNGKGKN